MSSRLKLTVALLLATTACLGVSGQRGGFLAKSEVVVAGGGMFYIGDLNNQSLFSVPHWGASLGLRSQLDNRWSLRVEATYGGVECQKDYIARRNLSFRSALGEGAVMAEFSFRPYGRGSTESAWTPYIFGGLGFFRFNPEASYTDSEGQTQWIALQPLHTEGQATSAHPERKVYSLTQLTLPFGIGVRWRLGKTLSVTAEYGFRKTWTDYLDDVSTTYVDRQVLEAEVEDGSMAARMADRSSEVVADYVNAAGIKRGDDSLDDWYSYFRISLGFNMETLFGWMRSKRCKL